MRRVPRSAHVIFTWRDYGLIDHFWPQDRARTSRLQTAWCGCESDSGFKSRFKRGRGPMITRRRFLRYSAIAGGGGNDSSEVSSTPRGSVRSEPELTKVHYDPSRAGDRGGKQYGPVPAIGDQKYLGVVIVASRGRPVLLHVANQLPNKALIPVDPPLPAGRDGRTVGNLPMNRIVTHLHGGLTPWFSDGTPFQWFTPNGFSGPSFMNVPGTNPPVGTATHYYPMDQSARSLWYHDHAVGITRTNAYAGIASALVLTDDFEISLVNQGLLPDLIGIPLIIQDKSFVPQRIHSVDPDWHWGAPGSLWYPHVYEPNQTGGTGPHPSCSLNPER